MVKKNDDKRPELTDDEAKVLYAKQVEEEHAKHVWEPVFELPKPVEIKPTDLGNKINKRLESTIYKVEGHDGGDKFVLEAYAIAGVKPPLPLG